MKGAVEMVLNSCKDVLVKAPEAPGQEATLEVLDETWKEKILACGGPRYVTRSIITCNYTLRRWFWHWTHGFRVSSCVQ